MSATNTTSSSSAFPTLAFIGGGNMATAIIGGLIAQGVPAAQILVVEPWEEARANLKKQFGIEALPAPTAALEKAGLVIWAVKPQTFKEATHASTQLTRHAVHLSIAAGITSDSIAAWLATDRIVRAMPNTPALVGKGITGLFARAAVNTDEKLLIERVVQTTGQFVWVQKEDQLDAVTALSGSGPAYVFLLLETMTKAGEQMGLSAAQSYQLAVATFQGASELAARSTESADVLRQRVTSKGGTTHAAITSMQDNKLPEIFITALHAAQKRAGELAAEFGK